MNGFTDCLLGYDVGSSSVKASLVDVATGKCVASAFYPKSEAPITSQRIGWAEQDPRMWWDYLKLATAELLFKAGKVKVEAVGISYQMHGLVCVGKNGEPLRDAIIWCDSRGVPYGEAAFKGIGPEKCLSHLLNSPGNFTASKLAWVKENEPEIFERIDKIMLPGDYIAMKLTGESCTTVSGLSEGTLWDFKENCPASFLMDWFGFREDILPKIVPTFSEQGRLTASAAAELGLKAGIQVSYRAGDQPNNALSLNVFNPGDVAATAGTSGVVYGVNGEYGYDPQSRVNTFAHVNHTAEAPRLGILLCVNGTGILNSWVRRNAIPQDLSYAEMNDIAAGIPIGSEGVLISPFGNGAERMFGNKEIGCRLSGLNFNVHNWRHVVRAAQEGVAFSFRYGMDIMSEMGMKVNVIHAGNANMFLSPVFRNTLAGVTGATIELHDTDGSVGAAKGAGMGVGIFKNNDEAFSTLERLAVVEPADQEAYQEAYGSWKEELDKVVTY